MSEKNGNKSSAREYADKLREPKADARAQESREKSTALAPVDHTPEALGLEVFTPEATDLITFTPHTRRQMREQGYQQVEKYLSLKPVVVDGQAMAVGVEAFILGWSATLIEDISDPTKLRYIRKLHLELKSGTRVSMLENAQLAELFRVPLDGSVSANIYRGGTTTLPDGRQMAQFESYIRLGARQPTHKPGEAYAQICGEAALRFQLQNMTEAQLLRVEAAPPGLLAPYLAAAKERELAAAMAERDARAQAGQAKA